MMLFPENLLQVDTVLSHGALLNYRSRSSVAYISSNGVGARCSPFVSPRTPFCNSLPVPNVLMIGSWRHLSSEFEKRTSINSVHFYELYSLLVKITTLFLTRVRNGQEIIVEACES